MFYLSKRLGPKLQTSLKMSLEVEQKHILPQKKLYTAIIQSFNEILYNAIDDWLSPNSEQPYNPHLRPPLLINTLDSIQTFAKAKIQRYNNTRKFGRTCIANSLDKFSYFKYEKNKDIHPCICL